MIAMEKTYVIPWNIGKFTSDNMLRRAAIHLSFKNAEFPCSTKP